MQATIATTPPSTPAAKTEKSKDRSKPKKDGVVPEVVVSPELMDTFTQATRENQEANMLAEHDAQLQAGNRLHQERIAALWAQLSTQLFTIWNEVWMQRQKVHDESFKNWLKLLIS